jgi:hypothetical protein
MPRAPLPPARSRSPRIGNVTGLPERGNALPLVGELLLLKASENARIGVAGVVEIAGRALLVGDVLIVLVGNRRSETLQDAAAKRLRVCAGEVTPRRGKLPVGRVRDVGDLG